MRLSTFCAAALLAAGSIGIAYASPTDLITNGDFSNSSQAAPWGFGTLGSGNAGVWGGGSCTDGDPLISGWSGNGGYEIWYPTIASASSTEPCAYYHGETQLLRPIDTTGLPAGTQDVSFVGMDGISSPVPHASISQTINSLTSGAKYKVTFWWGSTQLQNRGGDTTEYLQVSLGAQSFQTSTNSLSSDTSPDWSGWAQQSFTFSADSSTGPGWNVLSFMSVGTPDSLPPFAVLTGVSMTRVPEPPGLAMFGVGLLGLGLLTVFARRRARRRLAEAGNNDIA